MSRAYASLFVVKVRKPGDKHYSYVAGGRRVSRMKVHADQYAEDVARRVAKELAGFNPGYEFKVDYKR